MIRPVLFATAIFAALPAFSQDSTVVLKEVLISAYQYDRPLNEIPAAVAYLGPKDFDRFSTTSLLPAINTLPGVMMEERSPGSYRLSIRGSSMRSPFGIRNVKVYWNDLPFTDPGGNTYLNLLDNNSIQSTEVIKGPGSSLYGAGTGGVLLLKNNSPLNSGVELSALAGSYGLMRYAVNASLRSKQSDLRINYVKQKSDGYRNHTEMERDVIQATTNFYVSEESTLSAHVLYSDLFYKTPGGLTKQQFEENPKQARPPAGPNPGAEEQKAAISNKTLYSGLTYEYYWNRKWSTRTGVYGTFSQFENPTIRNYERKTEQSYGGRTSTQFQYGKGKINFGAEYQYGFSPVKVYENFKGQIGAQTQDDEITIKTYFVFVQSEFNLPKNFLFTAGVSLNKLDVKFLRFSEVPAFNEDRNFAPVLLPRLALLKKINSFHSVYASYSQGYSPPTISELYPSAGFFDNKLQSERGNNIEMGWRSTLLKTLTLDITLYDFRLSETIVNRRDTTQIGDPEYFVNAGVTNQYGAEAQVKWQPDLSQNKYFTNVNVWLSYTWNRYTYADYSRDTIRFNGNYLPGIAPNNIVLGMDVGIRNGFYLNITANYIDPIPLNDANTDYASDYILLGARVGYKNSRNSSFPFEIFAGIDNALDEKYSLGNDLNAFAGRYYNPAPGRNYYAGIRFGAFQKKDK